VAVNEGTKQPILAVLRGIFFFNLGLSIYFFFFNLFLSSHGYSEARLGLLTSTMAAGNLAGALPAGRFIQRAGLRTALITCLIAAPAVACARSVSPLFPVQAVLAFAAGLAMSLWTVCVSPMVAASTSERERPLGFSLFFSLGIGVGALGGLAGSRMPAWFSHLPILTGWLPADQLTLIAASGVAAIGLIPCLALHNTNALPTARPRLFSSSDLRRFLPAVAIWGLVTGSFLPFANVFLAVHLRLPLTNAGTVFALSQLFQVAAVLCAPILFRRLGIARGIFAAQIATASCFLVLALSTGSIPASVTFIALTGAQYMSEPGIYSLLMGIVPKERRAGASASMTLVLGISQLIAAASAGWAFTNLGYPRALGIIALFAIAAGILFNTVVRPAARSLLSNAVENQAD
jgi:MFS family permease